MAFVFGLLFGLPTIAYGANEMANAIDSMVNFNYTQYFNDKISNLNIEAQIMVLNHELNTIKKNKEQSTDDYKNALKTGINIKEKKIILNHYRKLLEECMKKIKELKKKKIK